MDDQQRTEKILGTEFATIFLEECSQIPYGSRNMAMTRLAQLVMQPALNKHLPLKMYYAENPPDKGHWTYKMFMLFEDPESRQPIQREDYAFFRINPVDNQANISDSYLKTLEALPVRMRKRFLEGEFRDAAPNALFNDEAFERWRAIDGELPEMLRQWKIYKDSGFKNPPGVKAGTLLPPGSDEPKCWWATGDLIAEKREGGTF